LEDFKNKYFDPHFPQKNNLMQSVETINICLLQIYSDLHSNLSLNKNTEFDSTYCKN